MWSLQIAVLALAFSVVGVWGGWQWKQTVVGGEDKQ